MTFFGQHSGKINSIKPMYMIIILYSSLGFGKRSYSMFYITSSMFRISSINFWASCNIYINYFPWYTQKDQPHLFSCTPYLLVSVSSKSQRVTNLPFIKVNLLKGTRYFWWWEITPSKLVMIPIFGFGFLIDLVPRPQWWTQ